MTDNPKNRSKKISRQINRYLGREDAEAVVDTIINDAAVKSISPELRAVINGIPQFLDAVDSSYQKYEENISVAERNLNISSRESIDAQSAIRLMVNSLGQGFLLFDRNGICAPIYSMACEKLLETSPVGKHINDVLRLDNAAGERMNSVLKLVFDGAHAMSFDELMKLAPNKYVHSAGRHVRIDYKCVPRADGTLDYVVLIATDVTEMVQAHNAAEEQAAMFVALERAVEDRQGFSNLMRQLSDLAKCSPQDLSTVDRQREIHTLKSTAGMFKLKRITQLLHELESAVRQGGVDACLMNALNREVAKRTEQFSSLLGENAALDDENRFVRQSKIEQFATLLNKPEYKELRRTYLTDICAESLISRIRRYDMLIKEIASRQQKKVNPIRFEGQDVQIVMRVYESVFAVLGHVFSNAVVHGIERPAERILCGKPEEGQITVRVSLERSAPLQNINIEVSDDGAGIDPEQLRRKLKKQYPEVDWEHYNDVEILDQIFTAGFTTINTVDDISGRGIGLDAVRSEMQKLGGVVTVQSVKNQGTVISLKLPYLLERKN